MIASVHSKNSIWASSGRDGKDSRGVVKEHSGGALCDHRLCFTTVSVAQSFRSTCGSLRIRPECSTQRCPAATPHV